MPQPSVASHPDQALVQQIHDLQRRVDALERQGDRLIVDPRTVGNAGDSAHGNATAALGNLGLVGLPGQFGLASFRTGTWVAL